MGSIADYNYVYDGVGNIKEIHDALDPAYNRDFSYDDLSRLTLANSGAALWGAGSYQYDAMGNVTGLNLGSTRTSTFSYQGSTPKLNTATENGVARSVLYDSAGNDGPWKRTTTTTSRSSSPALNAAITAS